MRQVLGVLVLGATLGMSAAAEAQYSTQPYGTQPPARAPAAAAPHASQPKAPAKAPAAQPQAGAATAADAPLKQRIEQLEEQVIDLQVALGTLESMGGKGAAPARGAAAISSFSGAEAGRLAALETQMQALSAQVEQINEQMRALRGGAPGPAAAAGTYRSMPTTPAPNAGGGFQTRTVPAGSDPIGQLIGGPPEQRPGQVASATLPPLASSSAGSKQLYEQSYSQLLQQNYADAEAGFAEFLKRYPNDEMTANAQFWLGETHFVRGQWDQAASAFFKVAQTHGNSVKAPDSLARLAASLERKGNKQAACRALIELNTRYPSPPAHVKTWEAQERKRAGCA